MADQHNNQPNRELSSKLQAFEAQLASLQPTTGRLERDRLMFEAGKAAAEAEQATPARSAHWVWPAGSTVMTAAATLLLAVIVLRPDSLVVNKSGEMNREPPKPAAGALGSPSATQNATDPVEQEQESSWKTIVSWLPGSGSTPDESSATYLRQRDMLLAFGGDRLPELKTTSSAKGGRSNTRVSYADLLDELTLETQGFAPSSNGSDRLKPSYQGTDL